MYVATTHRSRNRGGGKRSSPPPQIPRGEGRKHLSAPPPPHTHTHFLRNALYKLTFLGRSRVWPGLRFPLIVYHPTHMRQPLPRHVFIKRRVFLSVSGQPPFLHHLSLPFQMCFQIQDALYFQLQRPLSLLAVHPLFSQVQYRPLAAHHSSTA